MSNNSIPFRLRRDLEWVEREATNGAGPWVLFDPVQTEYFYLNDSERRIAMLMDGKKSTLEIVQLVLPSHPLNVAIRFVNNLVQRMDQAGLLIANHWSRSSLVRTTHDIRSRSEHSILGFKVRVFDPSHFITAIGPVASLLFTWQCFSMVCVSMLIVVCGLVPDAGTLLRDLQLATDMSIAQVAMIGGLLFFIKVLHEIGHALAGYRFGATCREVGVFFFIGIPCLYCDMSDSWRVKGKWSRITIAAAGIYVEMIVAIIAATAWLASDSLWIRVSAVQIMLACSISTLLFNANPLLRYDGYFALADFLGIVNLLDRARNSWNTLWSRLILKNTDDQDGSFVSHALFACYYLLSVSYRWLLIGGLLLGIYGWFSDGKMQALATGLPLLLLFVLLLQFSFSYWNTFRRFLFGVSVIRLRWSAIVFLTVIWLMIASAFFFWRSSESIVVRAVVESDGVVPVFLPHDATIIALLPDGASVSPGEMVARATSFEMEDELLRLQGELTLCQVRRSHWENRSTQDPSLVQSIFELNQKLSGLKDQIEHLNLEIEQLSIVSKCDGVFSTSLAVPWSWRTRMSDSTEPIDFQGVTHGKPILKRGALLGTIVPQGNLTSRPRLQSMNDTVCVRAYVKERDISSIEIGDAVSIYVEQSNVKSFGTVDKIGQEPASDIPDMLKNDSLYRMSVTESKIGTATNEYLVSVRLHAVDDQLIRGGLATVQFQGNDSTVAEWLWNYLRQYLD